jgi:hypothetical protein
MGVNCETGYKRQDQDFFPLGERTHQPGPAFMVFEKQMRQQVWRDLFNRAVPRTRWGD